MIGIFYGLMALGLSLIFGILKVVNFAHGEFYMVGGYIYVQLATHLGLAPSLALLSAMVGGAAVGILVERLLIRPLYTEFTQWGAARDEYAIIVTFGLSLFLINLATVVFGPYATKGPDLIPGERITLGPITTGTNRISALLVGGGLLALTYLAVRFTPWGKTVQAVAQNRFGASIAGIDPAKVSMFGLAIAGGLAALSGSLLSPIFHVFPDVGTFPAIKSFIIVVMGGMGSLLGSILGGLILGVFESLSAVYISLVYKDAFGFLLLIVTLLVRPWGLFGERMRGV